MKRLPFRLYQNAKSRYIARSPEEAQRQFELDMDGDVEGLGETPFVRIRDDKLVEVCREDPEGTPGEVKREYKNGDGDVVGYVWCETKTAREWCSEYDAPCLFSGGDY